MSDKKKQQSKLLVKVRGLLLGLCLIAGVGVGAAYAEESSNSTTTTDNRKLQNGSFEEGQSFTKNYLQQDQSAVPSWNTTAFEGQIELFRENTGVYIQNKVTLKPTDKTYAAELNADQSAVPYTYSSLF